MIRLPIRGFAVILFLSLSLPAGAQDQVRRHFTVALFSTNSQLPGGSMKPVHPGMHLGMEFQHNQSLRNHWFQTAKLGAFYHRYSQTAVQLFTETGYRHVWWRGLGTELRLGVGYLHTFPATQVFEFRDGEYHRRRFYGRPQFMCAATAGLSYRISPGWRVFADYQMILQLPFVNQYVLLLPNTSLHVGVALPVAKVQKN